MESSFMVRILQSRDRDGLHLPGQAAGASAIIDLNVIRDTGRYGITLIREVTRTSSATLLKMSPAEDAHGQEFTYKSAG